MPSVANTNTEFGPINTQETECLIYASYVTS
ncbi:hypothetical protein [Pseudomonas sp. 37 R 15]|nr:hypothetical protein [Pseudomonas sp. 28 E 9]CRM62573.1 hypothetical protein [Pseudomonas sp. 37 R 15]